MHKAVVQFIQTKVHRRPGPWFIAQNACARLSVLSVVWQVAASVSHTSANVCVHMRSISRMQGASCDSVLGPALPPMLALALAAEAGLAAGAREGHVAHAVVAEAAVRVAATLGILCVRGRTRRAKEQAQQARRGRGGQARAAQACMHPSALTETARHRQH